MTVHSSVEARSPWSDGVVYGPSPHAIAVGVHPVLEAAGFGPPGRAVFMSWVQPSGHQNLPQSLVASLQFGDHQIKIIRKFEKRRSFIWWAYLCQPTASSGRQLVSRVCHAS